MKMKIYNPKLCRTKEVVKRVNIIQLYILQEKISNKQLNDTKGSKKRKNKES